MKIPTQKPTVPPTPQLSDAWDSRQCEGCGEATGPITLLSEKCKVLKVTVVTVEQASKAYQEPRSCDFKWLNYMNCKLYLNKTISKTKIQPDVRKLETGINILR